MLWTSSGTPQDMIRVIGYDEDQSSDLTAPDYSYASLPKEYFSFPGQVITTMDGDDVSDRFEAFVHAPFKGDCAAARNDTSLALRVTLTEGTASGRILLMGDLAYATISRIFDISDPGAVAWDVLPSGYLMTPAYRTKRPPSPGVTPAIENP